MHALGLEFGSAAQLSKRPGSVWNCLWGNALKRSPGIIRKRRVSYPGPGFLSSASWPSLPKKHYNGLNQTKPFLRTIKVASALISEPTTHTLRSGASNKYAHDLNLVRLKCGVECVVYGVDHLICIIKAGQ